jgi:hypothetical protein
MIERPGPLHWLLCLVSAAVLVCLVYQSRTQTDPSEQLPDIVYMNTVHKPIPQWPMPHVLSPDRMFSVNKAVLHGGVPLNELPST